VALDSEVLCDHNIVVSSSAHFPFGSSCNFLEMAWRMIQLARSTRPLDWGSLTEAKHMLMPNCWPNSLKRSQLNWVSLSTISSLGTLRWHMACCQKYF
jgi:hypothetical protein